MKKIVLFFIFLLTSLAYGASSSVIWGKELVPNILGYDKAGTLKLGHYFTILQAHVVKPAFIVVVCFIVLAFVIHYFIIGPKVFAHGKKKIYVFTVFNRTIHQLAVISFILLIPTGLILMFGGFFGGGTFVIVCRYIHSFTTVLFIIAIIPMTIMWIGRMLPTKDDIKWLMILGGYLSKKKRPVPAGKFNAGQKMWFWVAVIGGIILILSGISMYYQDFDLGISSSIGLSQIDFLRACAILHNVLGLVVLAIFLVHVYMSVFAIKGSLDSIVTGYKEEEEVEYMHSSYYKELKEKKEI